MFKKITSAEIGSNFSYENYLCRFVISQHKFYIVIC